MAEGDTWVNALLGAIVTVVTSSTMVGPVLGGALAGYLEGGGRDDGVRVGVYSGLLAMIPVALLFFFASTMMGIIGFGPMGHGMFSMAGMGALALAIGFLFALVYVVGFSALGGWLGNYVKYDTDIGS